MFTEVVYANRDNAIDLQLTDDSETQGVQSNSDLTGATKVSLVLDEDTSFDSDNDPAVVSFTPTGMLTLRLGSVLTTEALYAAEVLVHTPLAPNGISWRPKFYISVVA